MILFILSLLWLGTHACLKASTDFTGSVCENEVLFQNASYTEYYTYCLGVPRDNFIDNPLFSHNVKVVSIGHSAIKPLTPDMLEQFKKAERLAIMSTDLDEIPEGGFGNFSKLVTLAIDNNCLEVIRAGAFPNSASKLQNLYLHSNEIHTIEDNAFSALSLSGLSLYMNKITSTDGIFKDLQGLTSLDLRSNQLQSLGGESFRGLTALTFLSLSNNPIRQISDDAFADLKALVWLDLRHCELASAGWIVSAPNNAAMQHVGALYLEDNWLQTLPNTTFKTMTNLLQFGLAQNPWRCNNDLQFLETEIKNRWRLFARLSLPFCSRPDNRRGEPLGSKVTSGQ